MDVKILGGTGLVVAVFLVGVQSAYGFDVFFGALALVLGSVAAALLILKSRWLVWVTTLVLLLALVPFTSLMFLGATERGEGISATVKAFEGPLGAVVLTVIAVGLVTAFLAKRRRASLTR